MKQIDLDALQAMLGQIPESLPFQPTFLELSGYPHYENVCSNILRFYLSPNNTHGFGCLLLNSILTCVNESEINPLPNDPVQVLREIQTDAGGRIDLAVITNTHVIAIENKIFHNLSNDLVEYGRFLERKYRGKRILKLVLSLRDETLNLSGDFKNLTYERLIQEVAQRIETANITASPYRIFFDQFILTIRRLYNRSEMTKEEIEFLNANQFKIEELINLKRKFLRYLNERAHKVLSLVDGHALKGELYTKEEDVQSILFHYPQNESIYRLECAFFTDIVTISLTLVNGPITQRDYSLLQLNEINMSLSYSEDGTRIELKRINFFAANEEIANELMKILAKFKYTE